jgi:uncharacterized coiled-coil protein SlyX
MVEPEIDPSSESKTEVNSELKETIMAARIAELEGQLAEKETALSRTEERLAELAIATAEMETTLARGINSYKTLIVTSHPEIPEELINGRSIEEIDASLEKAQILVSRVRQGLEADTTQSRVPPGAPPRTRLDLSGLSPREKIQYGIGGKK